MKPKKSSSTEEKSTVLFGIKKIELLLRGIPGSPLVIHSFAEKSREEMRQKQQKKVQRKKEERHPEAEFKAARHIDDKGRECARIDGFKKAIVSAATAFDDLKKIAMRQALFVAPASGPGMLVPIETHDGKPAIGVMREDWVTIGMGIRNLVYRPGYEKWQVRVNIEFNPRLISEEQLLALVDQAGWGVGIAEGRPEKTSALGWGRFARA